MNDRGNVTQLLRAWSQGDPGAGDALLPLVYGELQRISRSQVRRSATPITLQTKELVHEAWLRLADQNVSDWRNRAHFFALASTLVRRILVDYARHRCAQRRDRRQEVPLDQERPALSEQQSEEILSLHQALEALSEVDARQAELVELRYFGGLSIEEAALVQQTSPATVKRDWAVARAWLFRRLNEGHAGRSEFPVP